MHIISNKLLIYFFTNILYMENCKVVLLGDCAVGKSCLAAKFTFDRFSNYEEPTIGAAFMVKKINILSKEIRIEIWDTAGQERYKSLAPMYYRAAEGALIIYDITQQKSFEGAKFWIDEIKNRGNEDCIIFLVGNKIDLDSERMVIKEDVTDYSINNNIRHITTSAKTGQNINLLFEEMVQKICKTRIKKEKKPATLEICQPPIENYGCC
jgi:small GTP-binding protein